MRIVYSSGEENKGKPLMAAEDNRSREYDSGEGWNNNLLRLGRKEFVLHALILQRVPRRSGCIKVFRRISQINQAVLTDDTEEHEFGKAGKYLVINIRAILKIQDSKCPWTSSFPCRNIGVVRPHHCPG
jgi:hypothetical protein